MNQSYSGITNIIKKFTSPFLFYDHCYLSTFNTNNHKIRRFFGRRIRIDNQFLNFRFNVQREASAFNKYASGDEYILNQRTIRTYLLGFY